MNEPDSLWPFIYDHETQYWHVDWDDVIKFSIGCALVTGGIFVIGVLFYVGLVVVD